MAQENVRRSERFSPDPIPDTEEAIQRMLDLAADWRAGMEAENRAGWLTYLESYFENRPYEGEHGVEIRQRFVLSGTSPALSLKGLFNPVPALVGFYKTYCLEGVLGESATIEPVNAILDPSNDPRIQEVSGQQPQEGPSATPGTPPGQNGTQPSGSTTATLQAAPAEAPEQDQPKAYLNPLNPRIIRPLYDVWKWGNLQTEKDLIPQYAATMGDALLVAVTDEGWRLDEMTGAWSQDMDRAKVWLEIRDPRELKLWQFDDRGNLSMALLEHGREEWVMVDEAQPEKGWKKVRYTVGREFTKTVIRTYRTGEDGVRRLYDYAGDRPDSPGAEWVNPWGFVPVKTVQHDRVGKEFGRPVFYAEIDRIDEINIRASHVGDQIGKHLAPQWLLLGATRLDAALTRDGSAWMLPGGVDAKPALASMDIPGAMLYLDALRAAVKEDNPELSYHEVRQSSGDQSGPAVQGKLGDLDKRGRKANENYTAGLVQALQMCLTMGAVMGLWQHRGYGDIGLYEQGDFEFTIAWEPIIPVSDLEDIRGEAERVRLEDEISGRRTVIQDRGQPPAQNQNGQALENPESILDQELNRRTQPGQ